MEFTLTFLTHLRYHFYFILFSILNLRFGFTSMQQGKMFFFIGLLMAVLQGGVVRRLPLGSEQKVLLKWAVMHDVSIIQDYFNLPFSMQWLAFCWLFPALPLWDQPILSQCCEYPIHLTLAPAIAAIPRYLGLSLYAISTAFVVPMLSSLVSQYGGDHQKVSCQSCCSRLKDFEQGAVMGVFRSLGALGRALGPAFGSLLFWSLGPGTR